MSHRTACRIVALALLMASLQQVLLAQEASGDADRRATIQSETKASLALQSEINSKLSEAGDVVRATLTDSLYVDGQVVLPRGTGFEGRITKIARAKRGQRSSNLSIEFDRIITPRGDLPLSAQVTAINDWDTEESIKANRKGELKGGHRGEKTVDNTHRGAQMGLSGGFVGAALAGAAGASGRQVLGVGAASIAVGMIAGLFLTKGSDIRLRPGVILRIKFSKPVTVPLTPKSTN